MRRHWRTLSKVVAMVCLLALVVTACAPSAAPPAEKGKAIKVGLQLGLTGPIAGTLEPIGWGAYEYLRYVNEELGGIEYRTPEGKVERVKLNIAWEDNAYTAPKALSIYKRQKAAGVMAMVVEGTTPTEGVVGLASREGMPYVGIANYSPILWGIKPIFVTSAYSTNNDRVGAFLLWVKDSWRESRPPRVACIAADIPAFRHMEIGLAEYAASIGVEWLGIDFTPITVTDATIELARIMTKDPDWIFVEELVGGILVVMKDAVRMGIKDKVQWCAPFHSYDRKLVGLAPEAMEGLYGEMTNALADEDLPGVMIAREHFRKYRGEELGEMNLLGWICSMALVGGLRIALERVGYEGLTRDEINNGLHSIKDLDTGGITAPVSTTPQFPVLITSSRIAVIQGGKLKAVSDWTECPAVLRPE